MAFRVLSKEETLRFFDKMQQHYEGKLEKPAYIDAWKQKIDETLNRLAVAVDQGTIVQGDTSFQLVMDALLKMRFKQDRLIEYWMNETPYRTWDELATGPMPTADELFWLTFEETEDYVSGPGVPAFVQYLEQKYAPGIMKDFANACLRDCDPLLAEYVTLTPEVMRTFAYPEQVFGTTTREVLESRFHTWCRETLPKGSPSYVQRLFIANMLVALKSFIPACLQMEFARAEATDSRFGEYMTTGNKAGDVYIFSNQRWMIEMLFSVWHR